jgi:toxin-antitoxin system PIN domain toxin
VVDDRRRFQYLADAHREDSPRHPAAERAHTALAESGAQWVIPWPCVHEFLAITTHPKIFNPPSPVSRAIDAIEAWFESPSVHLIGEAPGYWDELKSVIRSGRISGGATHDARIYALCRLHGVRELWSADRDFTRFKGIRVVNPLIA